MVMAKLPVRAGINTQASKVLNQGGWAKSNGVRFQYGLLQKLGGCSRLSNSTFLGTCRCLHPWQDLQALDYIGIGTNQALQVYANGTVYTISPIGRTYNAANIFSTTASSATVTITDASASVIVGDIVEIVTAVYVGGLFLQGNYTVTSTNPGTSYTILAPMAATGTVTLGGDVVTFSTTNTQTTVGITIGAYVFTNNQNFTVGVSTTVGGVTLVGTYLVTVSGGSASIQASATASSTTTGQENSGDARINYLLALPSENPTTGAYGVGPYGTGLYGVGTGSSGPVILTNWTMDNWGQILVAAYNGGEVYEWTPPVAAGNYATQITNSPSAVNGVFVSTTQQILITWGAYSGAEGTQDPLLIAWSDVSDFTVWTPSATNQAGSFRIPNGSRIVACMETSGQNIVLTDLELWSMQYIGFPLVFGFQRIGTGCGLISVGAVYELGSNIFWMSQRGFFTYSGGQVTPVPCTVWDFIWNNPYGPSIDLNYIDAIVCAPNSYFNEIAWYFPTTGSNGVCTSYVKYNIQDNVWDYGMLGRSAWMDQSVFGPPVGADYNGLLQQHETAIDFDGVPIDSYAETGYFEIKEGYEYFYVDRMIPDFVFNAIPFVGDSTSGSAVITGVNLSNNAPKVGSYVSGVGVPDNSTITAVTPASNTVTLSAPLTVTGALVSFNSSPAVMQMTFNVVNYPNQPASVYGPYSVNISTRYLVIRARGRLMSIRVETTAPNTFYRYGEALAVVAQAGAR